MRYQHIRPAVFVDRPNRFIANILIDGAPAVCHVKNTGRCRELLVPGAPIFVQESQTPHRKTAYDLICVEKNGVLFNIDSQIPNKVVGEGLSRYFPGLTYQKAEQVFEDARFDFYLEAGKRKIFLEVKGVTLEEQGHALFPDAPTLRGVKHLETLVRCIQQGFEAYVFFCLQWEGASSFSPNMRTHPQFGQALQYAAQKGVRLIAADCTVTPDSISLRQDVPILLPPPFPGPKKKG